MNLQKYLEQKYQRESQPKIYRTICLTCFQPDFACYCTSIQKFDPQIKFVILIHPIEDRRRIATGRMSSLCIENSELLLGQDFSSNEKLNNLLSDPFYSPVILYPGPHSLNLTHATKNEKEKVCGLGKVPLIVVIDGTWTTARKMLRHSRNLHNLPRICFTPPRPSQFRVRKQPKPECYSTIEAIHHTIDLLGESLNLNKTFRPHDNLLSVFNQMVEKQLTFIKTPKRRREAV